MIDTTTGERLVVEKGEESGPYLDLPASQLDVVCGRLDRAGIPYWVESGEVSVDGSTFLATIGFSRYVDAARIQAALDEIA